LTQLSSSPQIPGKVHACGDAADQRRRRRRRAAAVVVVGLSDAGSNRRQAARDPLTLPPADNRNPLSGRVWAA